ncbi:MAG TPA: putative metal-dependent hydrolase [Gemmatimonadaceae bacterium]
MASANPDLRYPVGRFSYDGDTSREAIDRAIADIEALPKRLHAAVDGLSDGQLDMPYRDGGWTSRDVVHHVPDSHMNAYVRFKLALTEHAPTIKPYDEAAWARLGDTSGLPIKVSLTLLEALHSRWVALLQSMSDADFERSYIHPEHGRAVPLREVAAMYAWHGRHHTAHILSLRGRNGWT